MFYNTFCICIIHKLSKITIKSIVTEIRYEFTVQKNRLLTITTGLITARSCCEILQTTRIINVNIYCGLYAHLLLIPSHLQKRFYETYCGAPSLSRNSNVDFSRLHNLLLLCFVYPLIKTKATGAHVKFLIRNSFKYSGAAYINKKLNMVCNLRGATKLKEQCISKRSCYGVNSAFFLGSGDFPNCPKSNVSHLCWSHSAVTYRFMQIAISN